MFNQALLASPTHPVNGETTNTAVNVQARAPFQGLSEASLDQNTRYFANYNSLQVQLNRRIGRLQWNSNYTWSRTITYLLNPSITSGNTAGTLSPYSQWIDTKLTKNVANRAHAVNFNMGYEFPFWL